MAKVLGLDLGTNSIGWALIDDKNNKVLGIGSRIFPEGVANLGDGNNEISKNAERTDARGSRRQFFRRRLRKRFLLRLLAQYKLCPIEQSSIKVWNSKEVFSEEKMAEWLRINPYNLRAQGINEEITLHELGRILYHMIQRRGFLSNSRSAGSEDNENSVIFKGDVKINKTGITETQEQIDKSKTLGSYLNEIYPDDFAPYKDGQERIRNRYTTRQMYVDEFELIWEKQASFHTELTDELKSILGGRKKEGYSEDGALFHQRPLRSQKHLVGCCSFEPKKTKCPISAIPFEEFRVYQWVNTVECNNRKLNNTDREIISKVLFSKDKVKFLALRKAINKADGSFQFNYKDDDSIIGSYTISNLSNKKFFGGNWAGFNEKEQEDIWHVLSFFDDREKLNKYAIDNWNLNKEQALKISKFNLKDGYSNLSRKAINNILPFLKQGHLYDIAVLLGGIKNAFGEGWKSLSTEQIDFMETNVPEIARAKIRGGYIAEIKNFLKVEFNLADKQLDKLYHHSATIEASEILDKLPLGKEADKEIQSIRNPIVTTALFELRKLVNEIIDDYGKLDQIKVEMARDLKISKTKRNQIRSDQKRLEKENDRVKAELDNLGQRPTHNNILKYKLWEECNKTCPYTGAPINVTELFTGSVQIEHIHPWSKSLNDSYMNKTLCFADENRAKGEKTPYEYYHAKGEAKWEHIKGQALNCFKNKKNYPNAYQKFKQFVKVKHDDDFISRQLNDTRYISREAKGYMSKICSNVQVAPGQMTANIRHKWGLNSILSDDDNKTRDDHRHHAVDALVMACSSRKHLQELSKWNRYDRKYDLSDFPLPWEGFRKDAEKAIDSVLVSHKKTDTVLTVRNVKTRKNGIDYKNKGVSARGQLHKETVFGKRTAPDGQTAFHVRKPIENLATHKHVDKVVDPKIRGLILQRIELLGGFEKGKNVPKDTFFITDESGASHPQIFLPNKNGNKVPVKKVRMRENLSGAEKLKTANQYVNPRSNHHVIIYKTEDGELKEDVVTFWTAVERKNQGQQVVQLPAEHKGSEIITTLQINDMFLLGFNEANIKETSKSILRKHLYRVQKISSSNFSFRKHEASTINNKHEELSIRSLSKLLSLNPVKTVITPTGNILKVTS